MTQPDESDPRFAPATDHGEERPEDAIPIDTRRRKIRSRSYLSARTIIAGSEREPYGQRNVTMGRKLEYNEMCDRVTLGRVPIKDVDETMIRAEIERLHVGGVDKHGDEVGIQFALQDIRAAIEEVAASRPFHPVRDYLDTLSWDGVPRLASMTDEILGAERSTINIAMLRRWFISAIARVYSPGCKADLMLVLIGRQGAKKSTFFNDLAGEWFVDCASSVESKDIFANIRQGWIIELGELAALRSAKTVEAIKRFISCKIDTYRPPFARRDIQSYRSCIFGGTSNRPDFLTDPTGARRFLPITVGNIDRAELLQQRDQIWAEATALFRAGEQYWLTDEEEELIKQVHVNYTESDAWEESTLSYCMRRESVSVRDVMVECLEFKDRDITRPDQMRIADILKRHGFERFHDNEGLARWRNKKYVTPVLRPIPIETEYRFAPEADSELVEDLFAPGVR